MNDQHEHEHEHELVDADDAVIGATFRRHLRVVLAVLLLAALAAGGLVVARSLRPPPPEQTFESVAPVAPPAREESLAPPALPFTDVSAQAGVDFVHTNGARGDKLLPESMGSGAAFFDADGDGDPDLLLLDGRVWPGDPPPTNAGGASSGTRFYRNTSDGGGVRFVDVTAGSGFDRLADLYATGVAIGDVDGDGRNDVFVAAVGGNRLLRNLGPGAPGGPARFADVTDRAGVGGADDAWSTSSVFFDYDNDGDLDLFVGNYVRWSREIDFEVDYRLTGVGRAYGPPVNYRGTFSYLYRNDGPGEAGVTGFTDVSAESGIEITNEATGVPVGKALGVVALDVDGDGWRDLMVANDTVRNFLFHNRGADAVGGPRFDEVGELWGLAYDRDGAATGAMGIDAGHLRDDGELGFAIGNFANEMTSLYIAQGDPTLYADEAIGEGVGAPSRTLLSFGLLFLDVDLDGRLDILQTNGHLETEIGKVDPSQTYEQPSQLFWNAGPSARATFVALEPAELGALGQPIVGRGSAVADIDGDGDLDVVLTQTGRRALLLRNDQALGHHWLRVRLRQAGNNPDAIGAWVELATPAGRQRRPVMPGRSYQSYSEPVITFGLGGDPQVESLEVTWPDGETQTVAVPGVDRLLVVERE